MLCPILSLITQKMYTSIHQIKWKTELVLCAVNILFHSTLDEWLELNRKVYSV